MNSINDESLDKILQELSSHKTEPSMSFLQRLEHKAIDYTVSRVKMSKKSIVILSVVLIGAVVGSVFSSKYYSVSQGKSSTEDTRSNEYVPINTVNYE